MNNAYLPQRVLDKGRAAFVRAHTHTATVYRRSTTNSSIRGGEGGPFEAEHEVTGRLRHSQGQETAEGGRRTDAGQLHFLCAVGSDITTADRLEIDGVQYEVADVDTGRADQLTLIVTLRK